jgi:hypothetical protein
MRSQLGRRGWQKCRGVTLLFQKKMTCARGAGAERVFGETPTHRRGAEVATATETGGRISITRA